jgi:hypothetical protein
VENTKPGCSGEFQIHAPTIRCCSVPFCYLLLIYVHCAFDPPFDNLTTANKERGSFSLFSDPGADPPCCTPQVALCYTEADLVSGHGLSHIYSHSCPLEYLHLIFSICDPICNPARNSRSLRLPRETAVTARGLFPGGKRNFVRKWQNRNPPLTTIPEPISPPDHLPSRIPRPTCQFVTHKHLSSR